MGRDTVIFAARPCYQQFVPGCGAFVTRFVEL
jgi:hypothetical protein